MPVFFCTRRISDGDLHGEAMKTFISILLWIWQAPQNIVGLFMRLILGWESVPYMDVDVIVSKCFPGGISLGRTIIVGIGADSNMIMHEYGHTRQSLYLGPLYLFVVGIPSLLWAAMWRPGFRVAYYWFFTERWADRLGGVKR